VKDSAGNNILFCILANLIFNLYLIMLLNIKTLL